MIVSNSINQMFEEMRGWRHELHSIPEIGLAMKYIKKGECSPPINSSAGYHLIWVEDFKKGGKPNLQDHWFDIENMSLNKKKMDWYQEWLGKSRKDIFIEIKS